MDKQEKILNSATKIFVEYGFHGSTIMKIATDAKVSKAAIHYYYRSKEKLYSKVLEKICQLVSNERSTHYIWFLLSEFKNNKKMFLSVINEEHNDACVFKFKKYINENINKLISELSF